ncbi:MAG: hypothetical protein KDC53_09200 [Saprospiraceae bacterium]|nr:hypothetical protein [Saprospiraceae bacterium]
MLRKSRCLEKWSRNEPVLGITLHLVDPVVCELASVMGFDVIWVDMEHHSHSIQTVSDMMRAARVGKSDVLVRPGKAEFMQAARLLEAGAQGIMYPRCNSAEEAKKIVVNTHFPPEGERGLDGAGPDAFYGSVGLEEYLQNAREETFLVIQLEDEKGMDNAEAIAAVDGVDVLFFGPGDYSLRQGFAGQFEDPRYWSAIEHVAKVAAKMGKVWGTPAFSAEHAASLLDQGARFITYTSDLTLIRKQFITIQESFEAKGFRF